MSTIGFVYPPSPHILQWLSSGQLANRLQRSLRLWVLLHQLYGSDSNWKESLPQLFGYPNVRDRLFSATHPKSDQLSANELVAACQDPACICHKRFREWVFAPETNQSELEWQGAVMEMTGLSRNELEKKLQERLFAVVHRSIRDDLKQLHQMGWLQSQRSGQYQYRAAKEWPTPPANINPTPNWAQLSATQTWELLRVLESIAFVQPNLDVVVRSLWEQVTDNAPTSLQLGKEPTQRIFIHLDYIISDEMQDQVDTYQEQLESLWHKHEGGVVQFQYWIATEECQIQVTTYPVCLHYVRRAKYLSAYGVDPNGQFGWHNYRLDRIASKRLKTLVWGDPSIPKKLKDLWRTGQLPTPEEVQAKLDEAWGFNFYLPRALLILRFPRKFARWYVDDTVRHQTFEPVDYKKLLQLIRQEVKQQKEQQQLLQILKERPTTDAYYKAWIRLGDINVLMRLRAWRPNGEVLLPWELRQKMTEEVFEEARLYQS